MYEPASKRGSPANTRYRFRFARGPWRGINHLEIATAEYIDWFNHRRLHGEIGYRPPIEVENEFLNGTAPAITPMERVLPSLQQTRGETDVG